MSGVSSQQLPFLGSMMEGKEDIEAINRSDGRGRLQCPSSGRHPCEIGSVGQYGEECSFPV
jgi:hypothetical protein